MNRYYLLAAALSVLLGLAHSLLGEWLIFRGRAHETGRKARAVRSTWHLATLFGWGLAGLFVWMAFPGREVTGLGYLISGFLCLVAVFWLIGTRGRHPAWIVFLGVALLSWLGSA